MPLPNRATPAANRDASTLLFGLLADGSHEARFAGVPFESGRAASAPPRFSPPSDWYGRWAVRLLHGTPMRNAAWSDGGVCPDDVVILRRRPARRA